MILAGAMGKNRVEMVTPDDFLLTFGIVSIQIPLKDFLTMTHVLHNPQKVDEVKAEICSVVALKNGKSVFCYKGISMTLSGRALKGLTRLIGDSITFYYRLFKQDVNFNEDIDDILNSIEKKIDL